MVFVMAEVVGTKFRAHSVKALSLHADGKMGCAKVESLSFKSCDDDTLGPFQGVMGIRHALPCDDTLGEELADADDLDVAPKHLEKTLSVLKEGTS